VNEHLRLGLAILVGTGWAFNLVAPAFSSHYDSNLAANAPLLLILGSLFATRKKDGDDE
jgi:hypothetical protein